MDFLGGLAIEKNWGRRSAVRVALGVGVAGIAIVLIQAIYPGSISSSPFSWMNELSGQLLRAAGWALGLMLLPKSDDVLQRPETTSTQTSATFLKRSTKAVSSNRRQR